jgi:RHS repeat-associated protein
VNGLTRGIVQYGYDEFASLAWAKYEDNKFDYRSPDKTGNIYRTKDQQDRKYSPGGRLLVANGAKYEYDEEGNLVSKFTSEGKQWHYEWQGNGMLKKVIRPDGKEVTLEYDALGRRTAKIFDRYITRWIWDGNTPLHEWKYSLKERPEAIVDESGNIAKNREEILDNIATWIFTPGSLKPAGLLIGSSSQSIITDYLGTPVEMYDSQGIQSWGVEYDISGKIRKQTIGSAGDCPFRLPGQYADEETGLYYNRFRYYAPEEGIYISQDPIGLSGGNRLYQYSIDPNIIVDLFGLVAPNNLGQSAPHGGVEHNNFIDNLVQDLANDPLVDPASIRKNQQQVDVNGNLVGTNRPDLQYNRDGVHHNVEVDTSTSGSLGHQARVTPNDPNARNTFYEIDGQGNVIAGHSVCP